ncbi:putative sulfate exporter family transporter [Desulfovirgula thermocuniculi]|uniref:putative sulfate exporter family transporter n=1 Tax=Desulfovirgula thermocuniculi TaxID=348842 RepID=UPI00040CD62A|nr:putative sulfate exporter family transporter [Desulfovirgula thermocuniculi]
MAEAAQAKKNGLFKSEDWWAVWLGLFIFLLGLLRMAGVDLVGWVVKTSVWLEISKALAPAAKTFKFSGFASLFLTYVFLTVILSIGVAVMGGRVGRFIGGFTIIFWLTYICWIAGHYAYIAATPDQYAKLKIAWSLRLTGESGFIIALIVGLLIGNLWPGLARYLEEAAKPEWYIKTAIVILGAKVGLYALQSTGLAAQVIFRGFCAIIEAYLIYWPIVYFVARKFFKFTPEWAAPLASGISICGVSAAIATGGAIKARPIVPIIVSSLVIVFAVVELLILPFAAQAWLYKEPMVAGAWMGLAVKTDGAAAASGAITDALIRAKAATALGVNWQEGWILMATTTVKVFIDIFIAIWAFLLAIIWCWKIECKPGEKVSAADIWHRFPKFVLGYAITFILVLLIGAGATPEATKLLKEGIGNADNFRGIFFALTFFSIGLVSNFRKLKEEGMGRLALVYFVCLFGFIIWVGLFISWIFFHGITPPPAK